MMRKPDVLKLLFLLGGVAWVCLASITLAASPAEQALASLRVPQEDRTGEKFLAGFYIYDGPMKKFAAEAGVSYEGYLDSVFQELTGRGFNLFYVAAGQNDLYLELSEKYRFKLILQLDACYLYATTVDKARSRAECAISIIKKCKDHPNVLAFSVREEPMMEHMAPLMEYYRTVRDAVPDAQFHLLYNWRNTLDYELDPKLLPVMIGTDRYAFWGWEWSGGGYAATPAYAFKWFNNELDRYRAHAYKYGASFQAVFTAATTLVLTTKKEVGTVHPRQYNRVRVLVQYGNQGWEGLGGGRWRYMKYYHPPVNATKAMVWLSVLNGANSILQWAALPTPQATRDFFEKRLYAQEGYSGRSVATVHILGRDGTGTYMLDEYAEVIQKLQDFGWLINRMKVSANQSSVTLSDQKIVMKLFDLPSVSGKVLVLVNTDIGTWPRNSVSSLSQNRIDIPFIIDGLGTLVGYEPKTAPVQVGFTTTLSGTPYEISSGSAITEGDVSLKPGEGMFVFIGSAAELNRIRTKSGMGN